MLPPSGSLVCNAGLRRCWLTKSQTGVSLVCDAVSLCWPRGPPLVAFRVAQDGTSRARASTSRHGTAPLPFRQWAGILGAMTAKRTPTLKHKRGRHPAAGSLNWLVGEVDKRRLELGYSLYRISKDTGITLNVVRRFFDGYAGAEPRVTSDTGDSSSGRCRFGSAVAIAAAVGLRFGVHDVT